MYQSVGARGISVNDLRIRLGDYDGDRYFTTPTGPGNLENVDIQWKSWFRFLPGLKRLDLAKIPLLSKHIVEILEAAATYCRHLEFLILPCKSDTRQTLQGSSIDKVMTTLYAAMERWYSTGGLRQLTVPSRNQSDRYHGSTEYIESVTKFCPKIEYLDGYQEVISYADVHCSEMWTISLEAWRAFNATCTNLRSFHWFVVPFADPFVHVFGEYVKPKLKSLSLSANMNWKYDRYLRDCNGRSAEAALEEETIPPGIRYEIVSENEGDADEEEEVDIEMEDLLLYRAMMARFIFGHDEDD
ncbi:hypothetical protein PC112_g17156 [Phytophthora cactorum]|nr:hypothetical protein PC112_g17156 [Phytophthora cactorum]